MSESNPKRNLPSVESLLTSTSLQTEIAQLSRVLVTAEVRIVLDEIRTAGAAADVDSILVEVKKRCRRLQRRRISRVINGSGVLVHTNLGRSPLGREMLSRLVPTLAGYSNLEFDLAGGKRGRRGDFLSFLIQNLTGAEAALAVNNNAAALFLILNTLANKKEVIVSRAELVQIGGGFRIPDIIRRAGARLVEVGTTNQTTRADYANAIGPKTALILKVHQSNFSISGFVEEVTAQELAVLAAERNVHSVYDLGSGSWFQTEKYGMEAEPTIYGAMKSGCQLACFSGDKLLGGTQAGIVVGQKALIEQLHRNPLYRVVRLDKLTLTVLEEVILTYLRQDGEKSLALWKYMATPAGELLRRAEAMLERIDAAKLNAMIAPSKATPGGGSLPGGTIDSIAISLRPSLKMSKLQRLLLDAEPPLVGYVAEDRYYVDLRAIDPDEDEEVVALLNFVAACIP